MKWLTALCIPVLATLAIASPAAAQQQQTIPPEPDTSAVGAPTDLTVRQRDAISLDLIARWQSDVRKRPAGHVPRWSTKLRAAIRQAQAENVLLASTMTSLDAMHAALNGQTVDSAFQSSGAIGNAPVGSEILGSFTSDTTYTSLPNGRCRVADSRAINSPITDGTSRTIFVEEIPNYVFQGGTGTYAGGTGSSNCGIPANAMAFAVSVTLLAPTTNGVFKLYRAGDAYQSGNSILYNAGDFGANGDLIVKSCQFCSGELGIQTSGGTVHYVIDVVGYFHAPVATELSCYDTLYNNNNLDAGFAGSFPASACAAGYASTSTTCYGSHSGIAVTGIGRGQCNMKNWGSTTAEISASQRCCRTPGR
jgi:hypothetical protein